MLSPLFYSRDLHDAPMSPSDGAHPFDYSRQISVQVSIPINKSERSVGGRTLEKLRCVSLFKTIQIFQSILSGGSQPFSRQMSEMSNAEEDCIDATEQGKGTLHTFTVDIAFTWGE